MKTTRYFQEQVLLKRPYLKREWCQEAIQNPVRREIEQNGRICHCRVSASQTLLRIA